jgi:Protein of unknown function (DUF3238)
MLLNIWVNAFIPGSLLNYAQLIPAGPHKGKTAIPLPGTAYVVNWATSAIGYLTDQRSFSPDKAASSRMHSTITMQLDPPTLIASAHTTSGTTEVRPATGEVTAIKKADMSKCAFANFIVSGTTPKIIKVNLKAAACDPLVHLSADIDYEGQFTITVSGPGHVNVAFDGKIDAFPAFECYAQLDGTTKPLFRILPPPGNTVMNLLGNANTPVTAKVQFP